ncbi:MAG TPA: hypothetical protein VMZ11_09490 [Mycobacteriales bacterium]|nr:hypothetical protein [Mycobacteriales bacterium]
MPSRRLLAPLAAVVAVSALGLGSAVPGGTVAASSQCPAGTVKERDVALADFAAGARAQCVPALRPEPLREVMAMNAQLAARQTSGLPVSAGALEAAVAQHQALAAASRAPKTPGWVAMGKGPLNSDVAGYTRTNSTGLHQLSGRIEDFAYDPAHPATFYAAVANGGVWETTNAGSSWHSVGDRLPTQITGAVELLRRGTSRTLVVGTGDPAYGGSSYSGLGLFWSTGNGRWIPSRGVPKGALTFNLDHDVAKPSVVYAATSKGLYRSTDYGHSFVNVVLPTTCTDVRKPVCYFANMVTDVLVRPAGRGNPGGSVLAAVGWRAGTKPNAVGKPQSPRNGLYFSGSGKPGTFRFLSNPGRNNVPNGLGTGFATDDVVGRVALGGATGGLQNHGYVYALVQDALKFNGSATVFDLPEPSGQVPGNTVFNGLYGSKDFGLTWTKLADAQQLAAPGSGTALTGANAATYAPGVQSWYNEWVQVDPTSQDESGNPTRIAFGLEEVWTGSAAIPLVPNAGRYHVVGKYFAGSSCGGLNLGALTGATDGPCPLTLDLDNPQSAVQNQGSTTHPDQHAGLWVPQPRGGVVLLAGNDGGAYKQTLAKGAALTNAGWGKGHNNGFSTLLPYDVAMSSDGTAVMGLQDNGSAVITPSGKQIMAMGGDGFFVAIDPDNPNVWYEEYTGGDISRTTNGGKDWTDIDPGLTSPLFSTPFVMDLLDARHLVVGGREIKESTTAKTAGDGGWTTVFDLGTQQHPGSATAGRGPLALPVLGDPLANEINNQMSAVDTRGDATYVGYCGYCDIVTGGTPFNSGIATNVGGSKAPKKLTSNGWHLAPAKGLPKRYINSVRIDPANSRTIYVTLGGYGRKWIPPGSLGDDVRKVGRGHVFKSTDAGRSFRDISGNLPDIGADDAIVFNGALVVANDLGVYIGDTNGRHFQLLGKGLPAAPVFRINRSPRSPRELVAASYGRGAYRITVPAGYAGQPAKVRSVYGSQGAVDPATLAGPVAPAGSLAPGTAGGAQHVPPAVAGKGAAGTTPASATAGDSDRSPAVVALLALLLALGAAFGVRRAQLARR